MAQRANVLERTGGVYQFGETAFHDPTVGMFDFDRRADDAVERMQDDKSGSVRDEVAQRLAFGLYLVDGGVTFDTIHDHTRTQDPEVRRVAAKVAVLPRAGAGRRDLAHLTIESGSKRFSYRPDHVRGEPQEPLSPAEVATKAADLIEPVLGAGRTEALLGALSGDGPVRALRSL
jgi:hypothetical protein